MHSVIRYCGGCALGLVWLIPLIRAAAQEQVLDPQAAITTPPLLTGGTPDLPLSPVTGGRQSHRTQLAGPWGLALTGSMSVPDPVVAWDQPLQDTSWRTEEAWQWRLAGPITVYGKLGANGNAFLDLQRQVVGKTGVAWKLPAVLSGECQLRGGPTVTCTDSLLQDGLSKAAEWWVELSCQWPVPLPLPWSLKLEYQGSAMPTLTTPVPERVAQDVRLAVPLGDSGHFNLGARHNWEYLPDTVRPWLEQMQLYVGLSLTR